MADPERQAAKQLCETLDDRLKYRSADTLAQLHAIRDQLSWDDLDDRHILVELDYDDARHTIRRLLAESDDG